MPVRVPFDPEVAPVVPAESHGSGPPQLVGDGGERQLPLPVVKPLDAVGDLEIDVDERLIPGPEGAPELEITIFRPRGETALLPCLYDIHGGGMITGHRYMGTERLVRLVNDLHITALTLDYRLAPEHPFPAGAEDCYAGLVWTADNSASLGIDPERIIITGGSAGGGLSAAVALMARDRRGPHLAGQLLLCPMLDDRNSSLSTQQYMDLGIWTGTVNAYAWSCLLADAAGTDNVSPYAAPTRASDLSNLPPAFIEVGAAEVFRDEDVEYASRLWAAGIDTELHVWAGCCHGFEVFAPNAAVSHAAIETRVSWLRRMLAR